MRQSPQGHGYEDVFSHVLSRSLTRSPNLCDDIASDTRAFTEALWNRHITHRTQPSHGYEVICRHVTVRRTSQLAHHPRRTASPLHYVTVHLVAFHELLHGHHACTTCYPLSGIFRFSMTSPRQTSSTAAGRRPGRCAAPAAFGESSGWFL